MLAGLVELECDSHSAWLNGRIVGAHDGLLAKKVGRIRDSPVLNEQRVSAERATVRDDDALSPVGRYLHGRSNAMRPVANDGRSIGCEMDWPVKRVVVTALDDAGRICGTHQPATLEW